MREWLYEMVGLDVGVNLFEALSDGVVLCSIANTIRPGIVPKVITDRICLRRVLC